MIDYLFTMLGYVLLVIAVIYFIVVIPLRIKLTRAAYSSAVSIYNSFVVSSRVPDYPSSLPYDVAVKGNKFTKEFNDWYDKVIRISHSKNIDFYRYDYFKNHKTVFYAYHKKFLGIL